MGKINVGLYDKIMMKPEKKINYGNKRNFYINCHLIDGLGMEFTACCLSRYDARGSTDMIYRM